MQIGWVIIVSFVVTFFFLSFNGPLSGKIPFVFGIAGFVLILLSLFATLTVTVANDLIILVFGIGLVRFKFKMSDVAAAKIIRIKWYSGYGIHGWPGKGWLINVSGLDAIDLTMKNGMRYIIGTDEPRKLYDAIATGIKP